MFAEDITVFFRDFATTVTAQRGDGPFSFAAIFDDGDLGARFGATPADLSGPRLTCAVADAVMLERETVVSVADVPGRTGPVEYRILEIRPDGTGLSIIVLAPYVARTGSASELHTELLTDSDA